jgi:hypothetical protein
MIETLIHEKRQLVERLQMLATTVLGRVSVGPNGTTAAAGSQQSCHSPTSGYCSNCTCCKSWQFDLQSVESERSILVLAHDRLLERICEQDARLLAQNSLLDQSKKAFGIPFFHPCLEIIFRF